MKFIKLSIAIGLVCLAGVSSALAQQPGSISGEVADSFGGAVIGAPVKVTSATGVEKTTVTDNNGRFRINGLVPGNYSVSVSAEGFAVLNKETVEVKSGENTSFSAVLQVEAVSEEVEVTNEGQVNTDADNNASALVLKEDDLEALPDDPDDLEAALQALAGGGAGPNGGQIYIDGFEGGELPPKEAIREIRINRDPFSAEFDQLGFGRIEILTKPGSLKFSGQAYFNFNDDAFNARNPFSENKADSQRKRYGGYISGPVIKDKASFSLGISNRDNSDGTNINATVLDQNFDITPIQQELSRPSTRFSINPRFDYLLNETNTLVARYNFGRSTSENFGGGFTLPSRGTQSESTSHSIQLTETAIINAKTVNESRFQYRYNNREVTGDNSNPAINVTSAFNGGGSTIGMNSDIEKFWEFQNYTTTALGENSEHGIKFGAKIRSRTLEDQTESNYNGTFSFSGFVPILPTAYDIDGDGIVSSIEQYRAKVMGETDPRFNPDQFRISDGNPLSDISQYDVGLFIKDDWRVNPGLTLSYGLRYENQTNIDDNLNFAPRFAFAYSPGAGGARAPKTVFRGGLGIFYSRFGENLTLQAQRFAADQQQQYIIDGTNPLIGQAVFTLDGVTNVPTADQLANVAPLTSTPVSIASNVQAPYTIQGAFSFERQLPGRTTFSAYYVFSRSLHLIRSRNINAPVCPRGEVCPIGDDAALQALRPDPTQGNLYQYESSGVVENQRLIFRFSTLFNRNFTMFANYFLGSSKGNVNAGSSFFGRGGGGFSTGGFPSYSYDMSDEYGSTSGDVRHTFFLVTSIKVPYGFSLRPFIIARSGSPFNITAGRDLNGDSIFNDRPTYGQLASACSLGGITDSWCDVSGNDPNDIIPRNFGRGPSSLTVNLSLDKTFGFGKTASQSAGQAQDGNRRGRGGRRGGFGRGGRRGGFGGGSERKPYNLTLGVRFRNILNTNNKGNPVGNITSPFFGEPVNGLSGFGGQARRIEFRTRFRW